MSAIWHSQAVKPSIATFTEAGKFSVRAGLILCGVAMVSVGLLALLCPDPAIARDRETLAPSITVAFYEAI